QGAYAVGAPFAYTGPNQMIWFEPGSSLTFANGLTGSSPGWFDPGGHFSKVHYRLIHMGSPLSSSSPVPYSHQWLIGNGLSLIWGANTSPALNNGICITIPGQSSSAAYTGAGGSDYLIDGLVCTGKVLCTIVFMTDNYNSLLTQKQFTRDVVFRRVYATYSNDANANTTSALFIRGGTQIIAEDCIINCAMLPNTIDLDPVNVSGDAGECYNVTLRRCYFKGNGASGQCLELQGNDKASSTTGGCHDILLEHCTIDSGASSGAPLAGSSGAYLDDSNGATGTGGLLYNVEFRQCRWVNCGLTLQSAGTQFGYLRFMGGMPGAFSGSLSGRGPNASVTAASWTAGAYQNNDGFPEDVIVTGGAGVAISRNNQATGLSKGVFRLNPGDTLQVTYSTIPSIYKIAE
ncbi:MAG: hypothetical protein ACLQC7_02230, partial [Thermoplasmata archaeon]